MKIIQPFSFCDVRIWRPYTTKRDSYLTFSPVKCCKEAVLYRSWCYGVYYQLEGNWLGCADRVEKYLQVTCLELCPHGRLRQCCQPGCPPCFLQPEAGEAAEAVSQLTPQRVAPEGTSSAVVTKSNLLGTLHIYGPGIAMTEIRKLYESRNCKGLLCQCEVLK